MNRKLSDKKIQALKPKATAYRLNDDNGLSCFVTPSGKKDSGAIRNVQSFLGNAAIRSTLVHAHLDETRFVGAMDALKVT